MVFSPENKKLLRQLGIQLWALRNDEIKNQLNVDRKNDYHSKHNISETSVSQIPKHEVDCIIFGEFPDVSENGSAQPFCGKPGVLLQNMLEASGLLSYNLYFVNIGNIKRSGRDSCVNIGVGADTHFLFDQLELISPKVIFAMGTVAGELVTNSKTPVTNLRGKVYKKNEFDTPILFSFETSYLIKKPLDKKEAWADLVLLKQTIKDYS